MDEITETYFPNARNPETKFKINTTKPIQETELVEDAECAFEEDNSDDDGDDSSSSPKFIYPRFFQRRHFHNRDTLRGSGAFYETPTPLREFHEEERSMEQQWSELFLDLIYVVVAARAGEKLSKALEDPKKGGSFSTAVVMFIITFFALFDRWEARFTFKSRFKVGDVFHRILEVFKLLCIALGALHLDLAPVMLDPSTRLLQGFFGSLICAWVIDMITPVELILYSNNLASRGFALMELQRGIMTILLEVGAFIAANQFNTNLSMGFGAAAVLYRRIDMFARIKLCRKEVHEFTLCGKHKEIQIPTWLQLTEGRTVPTNISFMIIRYGEWTVIMIGESVLQIILSDIVFTAEFYVSFSLSFLIATLIQLLHYSMEPNHAHGHVAKRSATRSNIWRIVGVFYSMFLISLGASFKLVLRYYDQLELPEHDAVRNFLCIPLALCVFSLLLKRILHNGIRREFQVKKDVRSYKYILWGLKLSGVAMIALLPLWRVQSSITLLCCNLLIIFVITLQVMDSRMFGDKVVKGSPGQNFVVNIDTASVSSEESAAVAEDSENFPEGNIPLGQRAHAGSAGQIQIPSSLTELALEDTPSIYPIAVDSPKSQTLSGEGSKKTVTNSRAPKKSRKRKKKVLRIQSDDHSYVDVTSVPEVEAYMEYLSKWQRGLERAKSALIRIEKEE